MDKGRTSKKPATILRRIRSFLSADRTCVLPKSWRHLGSTPPNFILKESHFGEDKQKFMDVLDKSLQVYFDQKSRIADFSVSSESKVDLELVSLLEKWIPIVIHDFGVKKFHLSLAPTKVAYFGLPSAVFESESLEKITLERCNLSQINSFGNNKHLKTLILKDVCIEEETSFAKFLSSCSVIEHLSLCYCNGLRTINMPPNYHNLKRFVLYNDSKGIYFPSIVGYKYFSGLTCLKLTNVPLSNEWFKSFSLNFPCVEDLSLFYCNGFDELKLSSRLIKNLDIWMDKSTIKAIIDAPSIKKFCYHANISHSFSFTTTSCEWNSQLHLSLDLDASLWFPKISEFVAVFSQSQINSLVLYHSGRGKPRIEHLSDISVCGCDSYEPVMMKTLYLVFQGLYYDSFKPDLMNGLFRIIRPREIQQLWYFDDKHDISRKNNEVAEFLCRTLQLGRWEDEAKSFWQQDLEEVSLEVHHGGFEKWHPVQRTISWSEYVATLLPLGNKIKICDLRFQLKWRFQGIKNKVACVFRKTNLARVEDHLVTYG